jgi:hypothetical protein
LPASVGSDAGYFFAANSLLVLFIPRIPSLLRAVVPGADHFQPVEILLDLAQRHTEFNGRSDRLLALDERVSLFKEEPGDFVCHDAPFRGGQRMRIAA